MSVYLCHYQHQHREIQCCTLFRQRGVYFVLLLLLLLMFSSFFSPLLKRGGRSIYKHETCFFCRAARLWRLLLGASLLVAPPSPSTLTYHSVVLCHARKTIRDAMRWLAPPVSGFIWLCVSVTDEGRKITRGFRGNINIQTIKVFFFFHGAG